MTEASHLFESTIRWLQQEYHLFRFFTERDIVWTVQMHLINLIEGQSLPFRVFNDHPMLPGPRRSLSADIAILDASNAIQVAVEFKYEPSHRRKDILSAKFPVVSWTSVMSDIDRVGNFVALEKARVAYSIFIDEGRSFRHRLPPFGSKWIDWEAPAPYTHRVSMLWFRAELGSQPAQLTN